MRAVLAQNDGGLGRRISASGGMPPGVDAGLLVGILVDRDGVGVGGVAGIGGWTIVRGENRRQDGLAPRHLVAVGDKPVLEPRVPGVASAAVGGVDGMRGDGIDRVAG